MGVGHWWILLALSYVTFTKCPVSVIGVRCVAPMLVPVIQAAYYTGSVPALWAVVLWYVGTHWVHALARP